MQNKKFKEAVVIGRFQPFHEQHKNLILLALENADKVNVIIGSSFKARNVKNPFTYAERVEMIKNCLDILPEYNKGRVVFHGVRDSWYNEDTWIKRIQDCVQSNSEDVCLVAHKKDKTSYYVDLFRQWEFIPFGMKNKLDATTVRQKYFEDRMNVIKEWVPSSTFEFLTRFQNKGEVFDSDYDGFYDRLKEEYDHYKNYEEIWKSSPYKPIFVTTDAVVTCRGHVLMVRRKFAPGKGLLALPGGFLDPSQLLVDSCIRELKEETSIDLKPSLLKGNLKRMRVFDFPDRSIRGRTVTHAGHFQLDFPNLPQVKGGDDASHAMWISFSDIRKYEEQIFEDHLEIIQNFIGI